MDIKLTKRLSLFTERMNVVLRFWITDKKVEKWANGKNIFFVLAIGRSGTKFLGDLLNKAPGAYVVHEPVKEDFKAYRESFQSEKKATDYIQRFRKKEMYLRCKDKGIDTYGEVNGVLRRHCNALKEAFPNAKFIHLIRDGRDVVRSMMSRKTITANDIVTKHLHPLEEDPSFDRWPEMTRFEKLCWFWQVENQYLRKSIARTVRLEELVSSYDYFKRELLEPLGLQLSEEVWQKAAETPKNVTKEYKISHSSEWDYRVTQKFRSFCGDEMIKNGYEL